MNIFGEPVDVLHLENHWMPSEQNLRNREVGLHRECSSCTVDIFPAAFNSDLGRVPGNNEFLL